jgi:hypothetical protein
MIHLLKEQELSSKEIDGKMLCVLMKTPSASCEGDFFSVKVY